MLDLLTLIAAMGMEQTVEESRKEGVTIAPEAVEQQSHGVLANVADFIHAQLAVVDGVCSDVYQTLTFAAPARK